MAKGYSPKRGTEARDGNKENVFKRLADILAAAGYKVRREKLKQGHGWRVVSGLCRAESTRYIFVDRRMPQDEQISFLAWKIRELKLSVDSAMADLPEGVVRQLSS